MGDAGDEEAAELAEEGPNEEDRLAAEARARKLAEPRRIKVEIIDDPKANPCTFVTEEGRENQAAGKIRRAVSDALGIPYGDVKMLRKQKNSEVVMGLKDSDRAPPSVLVKGPAKLPRGILLDKRRALELQQELHGHYASEAFQADFTRHVASTSGKERMAGIKDLTFAAQRGALERYGYEVTQNGAAAMSMFFMTCFFADPDIQAMNFKINDLLATPAEAPGAAAGAGAAGAGAAEPRRLELRVLDNERGGVCALNTEAGAEAQTAGSVRKIVAAAFEVPASSVKLHRKSKDVLADGDRAPSPVWVSGVAKLSKGVLLSKAQALALQADLFAQYSTATFQTARKFLFATVDGKERTRGMKDLTFREQKGVLEKYGFEVSEQGAINMSMFFMLCYLNDFEIQDMNNKLNALLGSDPTPIPSQPSQSLPAPATMPQGPLKLWLVLNEEKGSILVREGKDLASPEAGRLASGACVAAMALEGDRLSFQKVQGDGPQAGWASVSVKGKAMLRLLGPIWTVLNPDKGSLLVRQQQDLSSLEVGRLATGSKVEQLNLEGDRLQFAKLQGDGPNTGWVSTVVKGKEMCKCEYGGG
mmetsp:Transcript_9507/g.26690  ORF Transcript_9507/g.26690 Transcript_9507/m.26690 type:complete len:589 (+) Transcript_9507:83-1849(+)